MQNGLPEELVRLSLIDMDFLSVEIETSLSNVRVGWRRQTSEEYSHGLRVALRIALELKGERGKTLALVQA